MEEVEAKAMAQAARFLEVRVGSHLFGTDNEDSDLDLIGVYMPWDEILFGVQKKDEVDLSVQVKDDTGRNLPESVDRKLHDYRKIFRLLIKGAPNILHVVMSDEKNIVYKDPDGYADRLLAMGPKFVSKAAHERFLGYAKRQGHKMKIKPENYRQLEAGLDYLHTFDDNRVMADVMSEGYDPEQRPFKDEGTGKHIKVGDLSMERGVFVKKARKMIEHRLSRATNRAVLYTKYGYDVKFASNLIQLLLEMNELIGTGWIQMPLAYAPEILAIKNGEYTIEQIDMWAEQLIVTAEMKAEKSPLQDVPPWEELHDFLMQEIGSWTAKHSRYIPG